MIRMKILFWGNIAGLILLLPFALAATDGRKDSAATATPEKRLVLAAQAHLQLTAEPIWGDSVEAIVTVAVPDSCKNQRYLCRIESGPAVRFVTVPRYKWALRKDSLTVLSTVPLQLRIAQQRLTASAPAIKIHFKNADHPAGLTGTATLEILSGEKSLATIPAPAESSLAAMPAADSMPVAQPLPAMSAAPVADSGATATESGSSGIFYIALAILLIFLFGGLSRFVTWSQRRRFRSFEAKNTAMAFPHLQHLEPAPAAEAHDDNRVVDEAAAGENKINETPEAPAPSANLPAVISPENHSDLAAVLAQLHELKISLQQIMANQYEANRRLAQITAGAGPGASAQLALFDILNDEAPNRNGSSDLSLPAATDLNTDRRPVEAQNKTNAEPSPLGATSNLRIFFANTEGHNGTSDEVLLH